MPQEKHNFIEMQPLPEHLSGSLAKFIVRRSEIQSLRLTETPDQLKTEGEFLKHFFTEFLKVRLSRSKELNSPEIREVNDKIIGLFGSKLGITSCMDGRLPLTAIWGFPMEAVRAMRVPGGDIPGFYLDLEAGETRLDPSSLFARKIEGQSDKEHPTRFQVLNAHKSCAARGAIETNLGSKPKDGGLFQDVKKKREMGIALERQFGIVPIIFVPDPETGFGYMGLGQDGLLKEKIGINEKQYDDDIIADLVKDGRVISTKDIADEMADKFAEFPVDVDWEQNYTRTAVQFWSNIASMSEDPEVLNHVESKMRAVYSEGNGIEKIRSEEEMRVRSLLVLSNAYLGWLYGQKGGHPYKEHTESCVVIDFKNKGPFNRYTAFVVAPDIASVDDNTLMAQTIVRANRIGKKVVDDSELYPTPEQFREAPVPVILKTEIPAQSTDAIWEDLKNLDWSEIQNSWITMPEAIFEQWALTKLGAQRHTTVVETVNTLLEMRRNLQKLYRGSTQVLIERGGIVVLPILVSEDRKPQTIVPLAA